MMNVRPPRWAQKFIEWYCKPSLAEDLIGDLNEYFERNVETLGPRRAKLIYIVDSFKFLRTYTVRTLKFITFFTSFIMIGSYIKTSGRNVMRNKLFSSINIIGLAISMSVGLLLIAFIGDLASFDRFHKNGDRIYRVTSVPTFNKEESSKFASSSIKVGKLIREKVTGVDDVATIVTDHTKDAKVGEQVVPLDGFWAESSFLNVLQFPMVEGDPKTALKEPYSMVLTESAVKKLFGNESALGKAVRFDTLDYQVTGVLKDLPFFSHMKFEVLRSLSTLEQLKKDDKYFMRWVNIWSNYVYLLLPADADMASIQSQLDAISKEENAHEENAVVNVELLPLHDIAIGEDLSNSVGVHMSPVILWTLAGLAFVVILSACFNYTNLSIARSMRRFKEIGLRKVIGAGKGHVRQQFLAEAVIISLAALVLSLGLFLVLRPQLINMAPELQQMVKLDLSAPIVVLFVVFAIGVGVIAGFLPALFFSRVTIINALRNVSAVKVFRHVTMRKSLVVIQYTFTLIFITTTAIGYVQYKSILAFDLGFQTENILNLRMQGNEDEVIIRKLEEMPEVTDISRSQIITSVGNYWGGYMKYKDSNDSTIAWYNIIDENYLPLHGHKLLAGTNFIARPTTKDATSEIIVNEKALRRFNIGGNDPASAIGEVVSIDKKKLTIVGVMKDYHYGKVDSEIDKPVVFMFWTEKDNGFINIKVKSADMIATMDKINAMWKDIDKVHPIDVKFYDDQIEESYGELSSMIKIIGFLAFLAISIASMGLFGMVVFTTETRLKEIGIRKVMGATSGNLVLLLSRGFFVLLSISALVAIPVTYIFFNGVVLVNFPYHQPIQVVELFAGLVLVLLIAFIMIGSQTMKAANANPSEVLKNE